MADIAGKTYDLAELSGRQYTELVAKFTEKFGEEWQQKGGMVIASMLLAACLKAEDGSKPTEDQVLDLPIRIINKLAAEAMDLNGLTTKASSQLEKN